MVRHMYIRIYNRLLMKLVHLQQFDINQAQNSIQKIRPAASPGCGPRDETEHRKQDRDGPRGNRDILMSSISWP